MIMASKLIIEFAGVLLPSVTSDNGSLHKIEASSNAHKSVLLM